MNPIVRVVILAIAASPSVVLASIGAVSVRPDTVIAGTPTILTVSAPITPTPIIGSANLQQLVNGAWVVVGPLYDDGSHGDSLGNDGTYTTQVTINPQAAGQIQFRISAAYRGAITRSVSNTGFTTAIDHLPFSTVPDPSSLVLDSQTIYPLFQALIVLKPAYGWQDAQSIATSYGGQIIGYAASANTFQLSLPSGTTTSALSALISTLQGDPRVLAALPNLVGNFSASNDLTTLRQAQPNLTTAYDTVRIFDAWNDLASTFTPRGFSSVTIGVLDSGIDSSHPAFAGVDLGSTPTIDRSPEGGCHGTSVAGIIGAASSGAPLSAGFFRMNGIVAGLSGGAFSNSGITYKLEVRDPSTTLMGTLAQIDALAMAGSQAINVSLGSYSKDALDFIQRGLLCPPSGLIGQCRISFTKPGDFATETDRFQAAFNSHPGITFVVAAGNLDADVVFSTPANIVASNVIVVGGTTVSGSGRWHGGAEASSYGANVTVSAPAEQVYTTKCYSPPLDPADYTQFNGTSAATPLVTGTIGLMLAANGSLTPSAIKTAIISTSTPTSADQRIGGLLNSDAAIRAVAPVVSTGAVGIAATLDGNPWPISGQASVSWTVQGPSPVLNSPAVPIFDINLMPGQYKISYFGGGPTNSSLAAISPCSGSLVTTCTKDLAAGQILTFTLNFVSNTLPTGSINVQATLDGSAWAGLLKYGITCVSDTVNGLSVPQSFSSIAAGQCSLSYTSGGPPNSSFVGLSPSASQPLSSGGTITFTLRFSSNAPTAGFTMSSGTQAATDGQTLPLAVPSGGTATVSFDASARSGAVNGATISAWQWTVDSSVVATTPIFSKDLGIGSHAISLVVTDSRNKQSQAASGTVSVSSSATPSWTQKTTATVPFGDFGVAMAYDGIRQQVVMLTWGDDPNQGFAATGATWIWSGNDWSRQSVTTSPSGREGAAMVFDEARGQIVLFGGADPNARNDTWVWDGATWTQKFPHSSPSARVHHMMAYDRLRQRVVLYGGQTDYGLTCSNRIGLSCGDTWVWDGNDWTEVFPSVQPPSGTEGQMVYDSTLGKTVLFTFVGSSCPDSSMWLWDGTNWSSAIPPTSPGPRRDYLMAFDEGNFNVVLFGGMSACSGGQWLYDTWTFDGQTWQQRTSPQNPSIQPLVNPTAAIAYDQAHRQVVLGGMTYPSSVFQTWIWQ